MDTNRTQGNQNPNQITITELDTAILGLEKSKRKIVRSKEPVPYTKSKYKLPYIVKAGDLPAIIRTDLFTAMLIALTWGMMKPMIISLKGEHLSVFVIGVILIIELVSVEFLPWVMKRTNLKTSTAILIAYDVFFVIATIIGFLVFDPLHFIYLMALITIPFIVLGINSSNKLKVEMAKRYPTKLAEKVLTAIIISKNRASLLAIAVTTLLVFNDVSTNLQITLFALIGTIQIYYTVTSFMKNYK